jgi:hypothetical protein
MINLVFLFVFFFLIHISMMKLLRSEFFCFYVTIYVFFKSNTEPKHVWVWWFANPSSPKLNQVLSARARAHTHTYIYIYFFFLW